MSIRTAALHTPAELAFVGCDDVTGIVTFTAPSKSHPAQPNHVAYDTATGAIHCDCTGAQCHEDCWHADLAAAAWLASPAMREVRWLTDVRLVRYGTAAAAMVDTYRARTGRVLPMDAINLVAARCEWRRRAATATPLVVAIKVNDLALAA